MTLILRIDYVEDGLDGYRAVEVARRGETQERVRFATGDAEADFFAALVLSSQCCAEDERILASSTVDCFAYDVPGYVWTFHPELGDDLLRRTATRADDALPCDLGQALAELSFDITNISADGLLTILSRRTGVVISGLTVAQARGLCAGYRAARDGKLTGGRHELHA